MSIADQLQEALDTIESMEQHTADAYAALQSNGASLPEKCNMANLAGTIASGGGWNPGGLVGDSYGTLILRDFDANWDVIGYSRLEWGDASQIIGFSNSAINNFDAILNIFQAKGSLSVCRVFRKNLEAIRLGDMVTSVPNYFLHDADAGSSDASLYFTMSAVDFNNVKTIGNNVLQRASKFNGAINLPKVETIGDYFLDDAASLEKISLPDSLTSIGRDFCKEANSLQEIYIPANCPAPSGSSLTAAAKTSPAYVNGVLLKGPGAAAWKTALPDRDMSPYRKLVLDPEWA